MNIHSAAITPPPDKRQTILEAALALFAERGFHGTSVPDIARRAGVGAGTIYRYFEGKDALVNALYQHHKAVLAQILVRHSDADAPPRAAFHAFWANAMAFVREAPRAFDFLELHHHAAYLDAKSRELDAEITRLGHALLRRGAERQILKELPVTLLFAIVWGAFRGLVQAGNEGALELTEKASQQAEACVWEAIRR